MKKVIHKSETRGHVNHGWLDTFHSFSFASYFDSERVGYGKIRVLNDDVIKPRKGFGTHPHKDMEIITIILSGELKHTDSMNNVSKISADEVQVMTAGSGVEHSEYNSSNIEIVHLLQIWIFPEKNGLTPEYNQKLFSKENRINKLQLLVSPDGRKESLRIHQQAFISRLHLDKGRSIEYQLFSPQNGVYCFLIKGEAAVDEEFLHQGDGMGTSPCNTLTIGALTEMDILILETPEE